MKSNPEIQDLAVWMQNQSVLNPYGEIAVRAIIHDGKVTRTERSITVKNKPTEVRGHNDERH